jgi:hypothetical protein
MEPRGLAPHRSAWSRPGAGLRSPPQATVVSRSLRARRAPCPVRWAGPRGHHPDDRREVAPRCPSPQSSPRLAGCTRRGRGPALWPADLSAPSPPRAPSSIAPSIATSRPSWPGLPTRAAATGSPPSSPANSAPTCAAVASNTVACTSGASSATRTWWRSVTALTLQADLFASPAMPSRASCC